jgi:hypothetical protein
VVDKHSLNRLLLVVDKHSMNSLSCPTNNHGYDRCHAMVMMDASHASHGQSIRLLPLIKRETAKSVSQRTASQQIAGTFDGIKVESIAIGCSQRTIT